MRSKVSAPLARLTRRPEYLRVARGRRKAVMPGLVLQAARMDDDAGQSELGRSGPRLGFTASKKVGNAVARNRARRRLKAAAQDVFADRVPENVDYVIIARAATAGRSYDQLLSDMRRALDKVNAPARKDRGAAA